MDNFSAQLNDLLVGAYHSIGKLEELSLKSVKSVDLSISELHLLEAIGKGNAEGYTIGQLAQDMGITLPSVTVAIKKLEKEGLRPENPQRQRRPARPCDPDPARPKNGGYAPLFSPPACLRPSLFHGGRRKTAAFSRHAEIKCLYSAYH